MGKRKLPFGYRMVDGQVDIHPQEVELVRAIFWQYLANASIKQIAAQLDPQPVRYDGQKTWNKNMIARIIEDPRYAGEKSFPAIIEPDTLSAAINLKASKQRGSQPTEAQKELRRLSRQKLTAKTESTVLDILNGLVGHPEQIRPQIINKNRDNSPRQLIQPA